MSVPLAASWRVKTNYTVTGEPHVQHIFCDAVTSADPLGYSLHDASGGVAHGLSLVATEIASMFAAVYFATDPTGITVTLEQLVGSVWNPLAVTAKAVSGSASPNIKSGQLTLTLRDTDFKKVRILYMESIATANVKFVAQADAISAYGEAVSSFTSVSTSPHSAFTWAKSRGNRFLNTSSFVSTVTDYNDKLRRARGTA